MRLQRDDDPRPAALELGRGQRTRTSALATVDHEPVRGDLDQKAEAAVLGVVLFALGTFMSWALLAVGAWAAIVIWRREGWRGALVLAVACGLAALVLDGALAIATGYDPIGALQATGQVYRN